MTCDYGDCPGDAGYEITAFCSKDDLFTMALCEEHEAFARELAEETAGQYGTTVTRIAILRRVDNHSFKNVRRSVA